MRVVRRHSLSIFAKRAQAGARQMVRRGTMPHLERWDSMKHQTKAKNQPKPSHRPKMSRRRTVRAVGKGAANGASIKAGNDGRRFPPIVEEHVAPPAETVLSEPVNVTQLAQPEKTDGLDKTYRATNDMARSITGLLQPGHNLVFGFGAITIRGFEFVLRCAGRSFDNIHALLRCRTPGDVAAAQSNWVKGHLQDVNREIHLVAEILQQRPVKNAARSL